MNNYLIFKYLIITLFFGYCYGNTFSTGQTFTLNNGIPIPNTVFSETYANYKNAFIPNDNKLVVVPLDKLVPGYTPLANETITMTSNILAVCQGRIAIVVLLTDKIVILNSANVQVSSIPFISSQTSDFRLFSLKCTRWDRVLVNAYVTSPGYDSKIYFYRIDNSLEITQQLSNTLLFSSNDHVNFIDFDEERNLTFISTNDFNIYQGTQGIYSLASTDFQAGALDTSKSFFFGCNGIGNSLILTRSAYPGGDYQQFYLMTGANLNLFCQNLEIDTIAGQIFITFADYISNTNTMGNLLLSTDYNGDNLNTYMTWMDSDVVTNYLGNHFLNLYIDPSHFTVYIPQFSVISSFTYSTYCTNDCSGPTHGTCVFGTCQCNNEYYSDDCSIPKLTITSASLVSMMFFGLFEIKGSNFNPATSYTIHIGEVIIASNTITVTNSSYMSFMGTFLSYNLLEPVTNISIYNDTTLVSNVINYSFLTPQVSNITQSIDNLLIEIKNTYHKSFMSFTYGGEIINPDYSVGKLTYNQTISSSGKLIVKANGITIYNQYYNILPVVLELSTYTFTTTPMLITITGMFFMVYQNNFPIVHEGLNNINMTASNVTDTTIIYTTNNGINPTSHLMVSLGNDYSEPIPYDYVEPQIDEIIHLDSPNDNKISITGSNFGNSIELVQFTLDSVSVTIDSVNHSIITGTLPNNVRRGIYSFEVFENTIEESLNLQPYIVSIDPRPLTNATIITITGNYLIDTSLTVLFDGESSNLECEMISEENVNHPVTLICNFTQGSGIFDIKVVSEVINTTPLSTQQSFSYRAPVIQSIEPKTYQKSIPVNFTISGYSFAENVTTVSIENESCEIISVSYTEIQCSLTSQLDPNSIHHAVNISVLTNNIMGYNNQILNYGLKCLNFCSFSGVCNRVTTKCDCYEGRSGEDCSITQAPKSTEPSQIVSTTSKIQSNLLLLLLIVTLIIFI